MKYVTLVCEVEDAETQGKVSAHIRDMLGRGITFVGYDNYVRALDLIGKAIDVGGSCDEVLDTISKILDHGDIGNVQELEDLE